MKKQVFSLMLSTVIFITGPLFGMSSEEDCEKSGIAHKFAQVNEIDSKGSFHVLPGEVIIDILSNASNPLSIYLTSKAMHNHCQEVAFWRNIAKNEFIELDSNSKLHPKYQVKNYYDSLFSHSTGIKSLTVSQFRAFQQKGKHIEVSPRANEPSALETRSQISIGKRNFLLTITDYSKSEHDLYSFLDNNNILFFSHNTNHHVFAYHLAVLNCDGKIEILPNDYTCFANPKVIQKIVISIVDQKDKEESERRTAIENEGFVYLFE